MISALKKKITDFFSTGHERSLAVKRNIIYSFLIKGLSILTGYLMVPLTIHYIDTAQYGIWLTISAIVAYVNILDIGLSNGLRNKMAASLALNERDNIVKYVSTTYATLFIISIAIFGAFYLAGSFFDWNGLLNINSVISYNVWPLIQVTLAFFCIQFSLQPITSMLMATHETFKSSLILFFGQALTFVLIYIVSLFTKNNLFTLVFITAGSPVFVFLLANIYHFKTGLKQFAPKFKAISLKSAKELLSVGGVFFIIQIGALVIYETDNIIITHYLGPTEVTTFNVAYKYFSLIITLFVIALTPYWSAFTDAYTKQDFIWIKASIKRMRIFWLYTSIIAIIMYACANIFYKVWLANAVVVPGIVSLSMAIYVIAVNWQGIYVYALNGMGKLRLQLIFVIISAVINIPLSIILIKQIGVAGSIISNTIICVFMNALVTWQVNKITSKKATGIWNK